MDIETMIYPLRTFINIIYIALMCGLLFSALFTPKANLRRAPVFLGTSALCFLCLIIALLLYEYYALKLGLTIFSLAIVSGFLYQTSFLRRVMASAFFIVLLMVSEAMVAALTVLFYGVSAPLLVGDAALTVRTFPIYICSYTVCYGFPALIAWQKPTNHTSIKLVQFLTLPLSQVVMFGAFLYAMYMGDRQFVSTDAFVTIVVIILCVATDIVFLHTIDALVKKERLEEQQALQKKHYLALMEQQKKIRQLRHDIANHLMTMTVLVEEDTEKAKEYLQNLTETFHSLKSVVYCENQIVDAVLFSKSAEAEAMGIPFTPAASLPHHVNIDDLDLMSLLSNLLDNAFTAASQATDPFVEVVIKEHASTIVTSVRNALPDHTIPDLKHTTKQDKEAHGLGIKIVEEICRKYNGSFLTTQEAGVFEAKALLLLPPEEVS